MIFALRSRVFEPVQPPLDEPLISVREIAHDASGHHVGVPVAGSGVVVGAAHESFRRRSARSLPASFTSLPSSYRSRITFCASVTFPSTRSARRGRAARRGSPSLVATNRLIFGPPGLRGRGRLSIGFPWVELLFRLGGERLHRADEVPFVSRCGSSVKPASPVANLLDLIRVARPEIVSPCFRRLFGVVGQVSRPTRRGHKSAVWTSNQFLTFSPRRCRLLRL